MNHWLYRAYAMLGTGVVLSGLPPFFLYTLLSGRYRRHFGERLGRVPSRVTQRLTGSPRIWLHAVSLGEVAAASVVVKSLRQKLPASSILLSTTTEHGRQAAEKVLGKDIPIIYGPIDFFGSVRKALLSVRPHVLGFMETEIWPAWLAEARRLGVRTAMINGRISERSINGYLKFRPFFRQILSNVDAFSMISDLDAHRIMALGAGSKKIFVHGNAKVDILPGTVAASARNDTMGTLGLGASQTVFVGGSTRDGEEELLLDAYDKMCGEIPDLVCVLAPRHISRIAEVAYLLQRRGFGYQLWSALAGGKTSRSESVVLVDTFGVLSRIYSVGTIIFCGGSLVPKGGQNPLEAAVWGNIVFYGPSMEDFLDARALLEQAGAGIQVTDSDQLVRKALWFYRHPEQRVSLGHQAKEVVLENGGAAGRHAEVLCHLARQS